MGNLMVMKSIHIVLFIVFSLAGCQRNGFISETGQSIALGSQSSVEIFKKIDHAWANRDYEVLKSMLHENGKFTTSDGEVFETSEAFIQWIEDTYQESIATNQDFGWKTNFAFSVKVTKGNNQDNDDGEFVNARFTSQSDGVIYDEWYYIVDNKLKEWEQSKQGKPKTAGHLFGKKIDDVIGDQSSVDLVLNFVEAINQKDFKSAARYLDEEMDISYASGYYVKGKEKVIETFRKSHSKGQYTYRPVWGSATKSIQTKNKNRVVAVFDVMTKNGKKIDVQNMMLTTYVKGGKIKGMWVHMRQFNPQEYKAVYNQAISGDFLN